MGPLLILLLAAMVVYGGWFWLAQSVQSMAAEGARAALGGLDATERVQLARAFVNGQAASAGLDPALMAVTVTSDADAVRVQIIYDVHDHPILMLAGPLPKPPLMIDRAAVVRIGGY